MLTLAFVIECEAGKRSRVLDVVPGRNRLPIGRLRPLVIEPDVQTLSASGHTGTMPGTRFNSLNGVRESGMKAVRVLSQTRPAGPAPRLFPMKGGRASLCWIVACEVPRGCA